MFLVNSRLGLVTATARSSRGKPRHPQRHTFSRSYGANLPSSFTRDHSSALGFSPRLRVSVCGTVTLDLSLEVFLVSMDLPALRAEALDITPRGLEWPADLPTEPPYTLEPTLPIVGRAILLRHPIVQTRSEWYRNIRLFPIDYAFQPRLRDRLTLSGLTFLRKP